MSVSQRVASNCFMAHLSGSLRLWDLKRGCKVMETWTPNGEDGSQQAEKLWRPPGHISVWFF